MSFKNFVIILVLILFSSTALAEEGKIKAGLALRTHTYKVTQAETSLVHAREALASARAALENNRWETVGGYLEEALREMQQFSLLFPTSAARNKLRSSLTYYQEKKYAQASATLEQLSEELRWIGFYKEEKNLRQKITEAEKGVIRQKGKEVERAISEALELASFPVVDGALSLIEGEILFSLAAWKTGDPAQTLQHLSGAENLLGRFIVSVNLAQARHYLARCGKMAPQPLKGKEARRALKRATTLLSKVSAANPNEASFQELLNETRKTRREWKRKKNGSKSDVASLIEKADACLLASGGVANQ